MRKTIEKFINTLKDLMPAGSPEISEPVLQPYGFSIYIGNREFYFDHKLVESRGYTWLAYSTFQEYYGYPYASEQDLRHRLDYYKTPTPEKLVRMVMVILDIKHPFFVRVIYEDEWWHIRIPTGDIEDWMETEGTFQDLYYKVQKAYLERENK